MRVCIPIAFKPQGGGFYFLDAFRRHLEQLEHVVLSDVTDRYDVLFTSHWLVSPRELLRGLRANGRARLVQRIDGAAADYGRDASADRRQRAVNRLADLTIFQSAYARQTTRDRFHVIGHDGPVIHNPVDLDRFSPHGERQAFTEPRRVVSVSWSTNPKKGAASIYETAARRPDIGFYLCGRYEDVPALPNLHALGVLDREALARVLRSCDAMLTYSESEACPNHVLEALASGLPVLYRDSGAMAEVIGDCGLAVDPATFGAALDSMVRDREAWSLRARTRAERSFHPQRQFAAYVDAINLALSAPPKTGSFTRSMLAVSAALTRA